MQYFVKDSMNFEEDLLVSLPFDDPGNALTSKYLTRYDIDRGDQLVRDMRKAVDIMEDRASRVALRRSIERRQSNIRDLEQELDGLDAECDLLENSYSKTLLKVNDLSALSIHIQSLNIERVKEVQIRENAKLKQRDFVMAQGICDVLPLRLDANRMHVRVPFDVDVRAFDASLVVEIVFDISAKFGSVTIDAHVLACKNEEYSKLSSIQEVLKKKDNNSFIPSQSLLILVEKYLKSLCQTLKEMVLEDAKEINEVFQIFQWRLGRLVMLYHELKILLNTYDSLLEVEDGNNFTLTADFTSRSKPAKVRVCFETCNDGYPFKPLEVIIDTLIGEGEQVSIDKLVRQLNKNATVGYHYLSRACNVVSVFMN